MPDHASKGPDFLSIKVENEIRRVYNSGRRTIELLGKKYSIAKISRRNSFLVNGESKSQTEHWLSLRPADGSLVPCASIEFRHQGNMRTVKAK